LRSNAVAKVNKPGWTANAVRVGATVLSAGAALTSILSYTTSAGIPLPGGTLSRGAAKAHRVALAPVLDTAGAIGDTIQLAVVVTDASGTALVGVAPTWTSGDPAVASVDEAGTVVVRGPGSVGIVVRVGELEARSRIVVRQRPTALVVDDTVLRIPESERLPLTGHVADARGYPIEGADVAWSGADPAVARVEGSDAVGVGPGRTSVTASAGPLQAVLPIEVVPVPASITVLGGEGQRGPAGRALPLPVAAQIVSRTGRPIAGVPAVFHSATSGAAAEPARDTSDARGMVQTTWRLGDLPGRQHLTISVEGVGVTPALGAEADPIPANARVELLTREPAGEVADTLREPVIVRLTDSLGLALGDVPVAWSTLDGGALTPHSARTDSAGEARATWKLGPRSGPQRAKVQVGNARTMPPLTVVATAAPGAATSVVVRIGDRQLGTVGSALKQPLGLRSVDRHGNPVPGTMIHLAPAAGSLADSTVSTDSSGQARIVWTLGREAGRQRMTARVAGDTTGTEVTALARAGKPAKLVFVAAPEGSTSRRPAQRPLVVEVTDGFGNPLAGQTVVFKPSTGTVAPARALTDAQGRAKVRWTMGAGSKYPQLTGTVAGSTVSRSLVLSARPGP
jgi:adhesin/invasin